MNRTERYLKRATLGLWGRRRREAQMELRGAIEDKLWRFQFLGLTPDEAERRALAELGPAASISGGLSRVHSVPVGVQGALLVGILGMLGVQVVASAAGVRATTYDAVNDCDFSEAAIRTLPVEQQPAARLYVNKVGRANLVAQCQELLPGSYNYLNIADIVTTLKNSGVRVELAEGKIKPYRYIVKFPGQKDSAVLELGGYGKAVIQRKGSYIDASSLVYALKTQLTSSLTLNGVENPVLIIDGVPIALGSSGTPVRAANILIGSVLARLVDDQPKQFWPSTFTDGVGALLVGARPDSGAKRGISLRVASPEDTFYGVVFSRVNSSPVQSPSEKYELAVRPVQSGQLWLGSGLEPTRLVKSFADLQKAHIGKEQVALLLKITSGGDLRDVTYQIVPPTQAQLMPAKP